MVNIETNKFKLIIKKLMPGISGNALTCAAIESMWTVFME